MFTNIKKLRASSAMESRVNTLERFVKDKMGPDFNVETAFPVAIVQLSNGNADFEWVMGHKSTHIKDGYVGTTKVAPTPTKSADVNSNTEAEAQITRLESEVSATLGRPWKWTEGLLVAAAKPAAAWPFPTQSGTTVPATPAPAPTPAVTEAKAKPTKKSPKPKAAPKTKTPKTATAKTAKPKAAKPAKESKTDAFRVNRYNQPAAAAPATPVNGKSVLGVPVPEGKGEKTLRQFRKDVIAALEVAAKSGHFQTASVAAGTKTVFTIVV